MYDIARDHDRRDAVLNLRLLTLAIDEYRRRVTELFQINVTDLMALGHVNTSDGMGQTELARLLGRTTSSVTSLIDRLEQGGFVARSADPDDRRRAVVRLTDEGRLTLMVVYEMLHDAFDPIEDIPGTAAELGRLAAALTELTPTMPERKEARQREAAQLSRPST